MILLSIPGTFRMILIIIAVIVIIRFVSRVMNAKNSAADTKRYNQNNEEFRRAKEKSERERGKVNIVEGGYQEAEDVDFEEVKEDKK